MQKIFFTYKHQRKEAAFVKALLSFGYKETDHITHASVILTDVDIPGRLSKIERRVKAGKCFIFSYPHSAIPNLFWDGIIPPYPYTSASFVVSEGHKKVMDLYGYPNKVYTCGWSYSPVEQFKPKEVARRILFAPIHPNASGYLPSEDKAINTETFRRLIAYKKQNPEVSIMVRHIYDLQKNGLWVEPGISYCNGDLKVEAHEQIRNYDLVVGHYTLAWIAVAIGTPTLMMAEHTRPKSGKDDESIKRVDNWDMYKDLMMFPLDILNGDVSDLIQKAIASDKDIADWKIRMIGDPFDPIKFVQKINYHINNA